MLKRGQRVTNNSGKSSLMTSAYTEDFSVWFLRLLQQQTVKPLNLHLWRLPWLFPSCFDVQQIPPCGRQITPWLHPTVDPVRPLLDKRRNLQSRRIKITSGIFNSCLPSGGKLSLPLLPISDAQLLRWNSLSADFRKFRKCFCSLESYSPNKCFANNH